MKKPLRLNANIALSFFFSNFHFDQVGGTSLTLYHLTSFLKARLKISLFLFCIAASINAGAQCATSTSGLTPTVKNDAFTLCYGTPLTISQASLLSNDVEPNGNPLSIVDFTQPQNGTITSSGANFMFQPVAGFSGATSFTYTIKRNDGVLYFKGHYYRLVTSPANWSNAQKNAAKLTYNGRAGYLATITSQEENDFIKANFSTEAWIAASDIDNEGAWKWEAGPEGTAVSGGSPITFTAWASGQPDNGGVNPANTPTSPSRSGEHYAAISNGLWSDYASNVNKAYLVEYGGFEAATTCLPVVNATATVTLTVTAPVVLSATQTSTCSNGSIGSVSINAANGKAPYSYDYLNYAFGGTSLDANLFDVTKGNFIVNGDLFAGPVNGNTQYDNSIVTHNAYDDNGFIRAEASFKFSQDATAFFGLTSTTPHTFGVIPIGFSFNQGVLSYFINGNPFAFGSYDANTWYDFKIEKKGQVVKFFSKKTTETVWTLLGNQTYTGTLTSFKLATQYFDDLSTTRTFNTKNWLLSFNPPTTGLSAGDYTFSVKDALGCTATAQVTVLDNLPFIVDVVPNTTSAIGVCDGSVSVSTGVNTISHIATKAFTNNFTAPLDNSLFNILNGVFSVSTDLRANSILLSTGWGNSITTNQVFANKGFIRYQGSYMFDANAEVSFGFAAADRSILNFGDQLISFYYKNGSLSYYINSKYVTIGTYAANTWFDFKIEKNGTEVRFFTRGLNEDWKLVAKENYVGTETSFKASVQYYGLLNSNGGFNTKNWTVWVDGATSGLCPGDYNYEIASVGGCSSDIAFSIYDPLSFDVVSADAKCYGTATGKITFAPKGGKAPYTYSIDNGNTYVSSNAIDSLVAGTYQLIVKDVRGVVTQAKAVVINQPVQVTAKVTASGPLAICKGTSVNLMSSTGSSYLWSNGATTSYIQVSESGSYTVKVTDSIGCFNTSDTTKIIVNPLPVPVVTPNGSLQICDSSSIDLNVSGGTSYLWNTGETTSKITVKKAGSFSLKVTDDNGCSAASDAVTVKVNPLPVAVITNTGASQICPGTSTSIVASGGVSYLWSNGSTNQVVPVNSASILSVRVTDANGCSSTAKPVEVKVFPQPVVTVTNSAPLQFCQGGSVNLLATGGTSYAWNSGPATAAISVASSGNYVVKATDANGCTATSSPVTVTVYNLPVAQVTVSGPLALCTGASVNLVSSPAVSYLWSNGETTAGIVTGTAGSYSVKVTDFNGCSSTSTAVVVKVSPLPVAGITAGGPLTFCAGSSVNLTGTGGTSYLWSSGETSAALSVRTAGSYSVKVTDANGCSATSAAVAVVVNATPAVTVTPAGSTLLCQGSSVNLVAAGGGTYLWNTGATTATLAASTTGSYSVKVTGANGCSATSVPVAVSVNPIPVVTITANTSDFLCKGVVLTANSASAVKSYAWSDGSASQTLSLTNANADGTYSVNITDKNGCRNTTTASYIFTKQNLLEAYSIIGINSVNLGTSTTVAGGSVGVTGATGIITLGKSSSVASAGAFVKAKTINVTTPVNAPTQVKAVATVTLPVMQTNTSSANSYPVGMISGTATSSSNYKTLTIKAGSNVTLNGTVFGTITIEQGATVTFTSNTVNIDQLIVGTNKATASSALTTLHFGPNSAVRVSTSVYIYGRSRINAEENKVTFFCGDASPDAETFNVSGLDVIVGGTVYIPVGTLSVTSTDATTTTYMKGLFIAQTVTSTGAKVIWQASACSAASSRIAYNPDVTPSRVEAAEALNVTVMPNPSATEFVLAIKSSSSAPVNIRIMDVNGRIVENLSEVSIASPVHVGRNLATGIFYAQIIQEGQQFMTKLVKIK